MHYKNLANKWRPKLFSDVVGQENIIKSLINSLISKNLHHSYIFSGSKGIGKTTIARLLAKGLNCKKNDSIPCGICNSCIEIENNRFIDLIEIDAASKTKVEDIRELLDTIQYLPTKGIYKIYLIDEVHMLSKHSFNALLKTLEEPPQHIKFFLATTELKKLPETIISRCLQFQLKKIKTEIIFKRLNFILHNEKIIIEDKAIKLISKYAKGSMRDALTLTDQVLTMNNKSINIDNVKLMLGMCNENKILDLIECVFNGDIKKLIYLIENISLDNIDWDDVLIEILTSLHQVFILKILKDKNISQEIYNVNDKRLLSISTDKTTEEIQSYYDIILFGRRELNLAPDPRMGIEMILLKALFLYSDNLEKNKKNILKEKKINTKNTDVLKLYKNLQKNLKNAINNKKNIDTNNSITYDQMNLVKNNNLYKYNDLIKSDKFIKESIMLFDVEIIDE